MKIQKPDRRVGYFLLIIGIILILIAAVMTLLILVGAMPLPIYVQTPTDITDQNAKVLADIFPLFNIIPTFLLFVVLIYAGSEFMGKGVGLTKEITWKVAQPSEKETPEPQKTADPDPAPDPKPTSKKAKAGKQEENE